MLASVSNDCPKLSPDKDILTHVLGFKLGESTMAVYYGTPKPDKIIGTSGNDLIHGWA